MVRNVLYCKSFLEDNKYNSKLSGRVCSFPSVRFNTFLQCTITSEREKRILKACKKLGTFQQLSQNLAFKMDSMKSVLKLVRKGD